MSHNYIFLSEEEAKLTNSQLIELVRGELSRTRGKLFDVAYGRGWKDRVMVAENTLTCAISYLYGIAQEMKEFEKGELCEQCKQRLPHD